MQSYKVYLTKSSEVAHRIAKSFHACGPMPEDIQEISSGIVNNTTDVIPIIYHDKGYYYCIVTLKEIEMDVPTYELTIC